MTPTQITADVDRGIEIVSQIDTLKAELKLIESRLEQAALAGETVPLVDEDREGRQFLATGSSVTLPVILESDQIAGSWKKDCEMHKALVEILGEEHKATLSRLYRPTDSYERVPKDGKAFRAAAFEQFGPALGARVITTAISRDKHGIPKSRIVIPWDRAS